MGEKVRLICQSPRVFRSPQGPQAAKRPPVAASGRRSGNPVGPVRKTADSAARKAPRNRKRRRTAAKARRGATPAPARACAFEAGDTLGKAQALYESGQFEDAAGLYERILGRDPRRSDVFHRIGVDAVDNGDRGAGAALTRKAIEANPAAASYHVDLAHALEHQGRLEETV